MTQPIRNESLVKLTEGSWLDFQVVNKVILQDGKAYFLLEDPNGVRHFLDADHYSGYSIEIGKSLFCKVDHINCTGRIFLEPLHPVYRMGEVYRFEIVEMEEITEGNVLIMKDVLGKIIKLSISHKRSGPFLPGSSIKCLVTRIKKGRPEVEIPQDMI